jgi:hypothetical protein
MPKQEKHANPGSVLGQLQRGRGEGYRQVLTVAKADAWGFLVDCITNDPRLDSQVESRAEYYAAIALQIGLDLAPLLRYLKDHDDSDQGWNTPLTVGTLGELAKRGHRGATNALADYVGWGQWWDWTLDDLVAVQDRELHSGIARRIEERFPSDAELEEALAWFDLRNEPWITMAKHGRRIRELCDKPRQRAGISPEPRLPPSLTSLTVKQLLELADQSKLADQSNQHKLRKVIKQVVRPADLDLLMQHIDIRNPPVAAVALSGLAQLAPPAVFDALYDFWLTNPNMPGYLRARASEVLVSLPPMLGLPLAREKLNHPDWHQRDLAESLLEAHATPEDVPLLRHAVAEALVDDEENCYRLCSLLEAFHNLPGFGSIPELVDVFTQFRYSYGRARAAIAISVTSPGLFREKFARECLWDCEERTRIVGLQKVSIGMEELVARIRLMASDPWEDVDVRETARSRVSSRMGPS